MFTILGQHMVEEKDVQYNKAINTKKTARGQCVTLGKNGRAPNIHQKVYQEKYHGKVRRRSFLKKSLQHMHFSEYLGHN